MHSPSIFDLRLVRNLRGFTLIELVLVLVVLGISMAIVPSGPIPGRTPIRVPTRTPTKQ